MRRPAQLLLFAATLAVATVSASLGVWQGRRLVARRAANRVALAGRALAEVALDSLARVDSLVQRRVTATGEFDYSRTFIVRDRLERDAPGVHVVIPLRLAGRAEAVLVNRGFAPASDAMGPDPATLDESPGARTVHGIALQLPDDPDGGSPLGLDRDTTWRRLDRRAVRARLPYPILDVVLHETARETRPDSTRPWPTPASLPVLDDGPHLSYMIQWFGIGVAVLTFGVIFGLRKGAESREQRAGTTMYDGE